MLTTLKEKKCFIIRNSFVCLAFHEGRLRIQQANLSVPESDIFFIEMDEVPSQEAHLFNSVRHIYNYLSGQPERMLLIAEDLIRFVVTVNKHSHICSLSLQRLKLEENELWIKKNIYQFIAKKEEAKIIKQKSQNESQALRKQMNHISELAERQKEKLEQAENIKNRLLQQIRQQKEENTKLQECLRRKERILTQIKTKEGAFVSLDD